MENENIIPYTDEYVRSLHENNVTTVTELLNGLTLEQYQDKIRSDYLSNYYCRNYRHNRIDSINSRILGGTELQNYNILTDDYKEIERIKFFIRYYMNMKGGRGLYGQILRNEVFRCLKQT